MNLKLDFTKDWRDFIKDVLINYWGYDIRAVPEDKFPIIYFDLQKRRIEPIRRKIKISDVFHCPSDYQEGWKKIQRDIKNGIDITPHLSTFVDKVDYNDAMLNDWGVHHLHLGTKKTKGGFIKRTGPLLFAFITNECLYAINVYSHKDWTNLDIIEVIHRNWPDIISRYIIKGILSTGNLSEEQRQNLRNKNSNSFVQVSDGTVYAPLGGGVACSGNNTHSVLSSLKQDRILKSLESHFKKEIEKLRPTLEKNGYREDEGKDILVKLEITENEYIANLPDYSLSVILCRKTA